MSGSDPIRPVRRSAPLTLPVEPVLPARIGPRERDAQQRRRRPAPPPSPPRPEGEDGPRIDVRA
jgi:hypothetical protein